MRQFFFWRGSALLRVGVVLKTMGPKKDGSSKAKKRDRGSTSSDEVRTLNCEVDRWKLTLRCIILSGLTQLEYLAWQDGSSENEYSPVKPARKKRSDARGQPQRQVRDRKPRAASKAQPAATSAETSRPQRNRKVNRDAGSDEDDGGDEGKRKTENANARPKSDLLLEGKDRKDEAWYDVELVKIANKTVKVLIQLASCRDLAWKNCAYALLGTLSPWWHQKSMLNEELSLESSFAAKLKVLIVSSGQVVQYRGRFWIFCRPILSSSTFQGGKARGSALESRSYCTSFPAG